MAHITVRDGRDGRAKGPDGLGAVLGVTQAADFLDIGDVVALADGTRAVVISEESDLVMDPGAQTVFVGTMPGAPGTA
jgi:hypothetical protein